MIVVVYVAYLDNQPSGQGTKRYSHFLSCRRTRNLFCAENSQFGCWHWKVTIDSIICSTAKFLAFLSKVPLQVGHVLTFLLLAQFLHIRCPFLHWIMCPPRGTWRQITHCKISCNFFWYFASFSLTASSQISLWILSVSFLACSRASLRIRSGIVSLRQIPVIRIVVNHWSNIEIPTSNIQLLSWRRWYDIISILPHGIHNKSILLWLDRGWYCGPIKHFNWNLRNWNYLRCIFLWLIYQFYQNNNI